MRQYMIANDAQNGTALRMLLRSKSARRCGNGMGLG